MRDKLLNKYLFVLLAAAMTLTFLSFSAVPAEAAGNITTLFIEGMNRDASKSHSGSGWAWNALSDTLTLDGYKGSEIITTGGSGHLNIVVNGVCTANWILSGSGNLILGGTGTMNISTTGSGQNAIYVAIGGNFVMTGGTLNISTTGAGANGIVCANGNVTFAYAAKVQTNPSTNGSSISGNTISVTDTVVVNVASVNACGVIGAKINLLGGTITAKGNFENTGVAVHVDSYLSAVGCSFTTGDAGVSPANGNVYGSVYVKLGNTNVTINGSIRKNNSFEVLDGTVSVTGDIEGGLIISGGSVKVGGAVSGITKHSEGTLNGNPPSKSIAVGAQENIIITGITDQVTFPVTTINIPNGTYPVTLNGGPADAKAASVTISDNAGKLALSTASAFSAGKSSVSVTFSGATSGSFDTVVGQNSPQTITINDSITTVIYGNGTQPNGEIPVLNDTESLSNTPNSNTVVVNNGASVYTTYGAAHVTKVGNATASNNTVNINEGVVGQLCSVYGGSATSHSGNAEASGNRVTIGGGSEINWHVVGGQAYCFGGSGYYAKATDNTVAVKGSPSFGEYADLWGGSGSSSLGTIDNFTGNRLEMYSTNITVAGIMFFQFMDFYLPTAITDNAVMIKSTTPTSLVDVEVDLKFASSPPTLAVGNTITLVGNVTGVPANNNESITISGYTFNISAESGNLIAKVTAAPLRYTGGEAYSIPASTVGKAIEDIDVSGGASGGVAPYEFNATGLPPGITINANGVISGTPTTETAAGTAVITVTDNAATRARESIAINYGAVSANSESGTSVNFGAAALVATALVLIFLFSRKKRRES